MESPRFHAFGFLKISRTTGDSGLPLFLASSAFFAYQHFEGFKFAKGFYPFKVRDGLLFLDLVRPYRRISCQPHDGVYTILHPGKMLGHRALVRR